MITKKQKAVLKKHLKNDYVQDVLKVLKDGNVVSRNKEPYSESMIRNVFNGVENEAIEDALLQVYADRKALYEKREQNKSKVLAA